MKQYLKYALPGIFGMLGYSFYILADTVFVAQALGPDGLAALNIAIPFYTLSAAAGQMVSVGASTLFALRRAEGRREPMLYYALLLIGIFSAFFIFLGGIFAYPISRFFGADEVTLQNTAIYVRIMGLFSPLFILNFSAVAFVRNAGRPKLAMASTLLGSIGNVVLDYVFMFPLGMGMLGAALATACAPLLGMILIFAFYRKRSFAHVRRPEVFRGDHIRRILSIGFSTFLAELSGALIMFSMNKRVHGIAGNDGVASYGMIANLALMVLCLYNGLCQGVQPLFSEAAGRRDEKLLSLTLRRSLGMAVLLTALLWLLFYGATDFLMPFFLPPENRPLVDMARRGLYLYSVGFLFAALNLVLLMRRIAAGDSLPAFLLSLLRGYVLILPTIWLLPYVLHLDGIWLSFPFAEFLSLLAYPLILFLLPKERNLPPLR